MAGTYITRQGETVDLACWRFYGKTSGTVEAVLDANPGLSGKGLILPIGTIITMPNIAGSRTATPLVKLWD